MEDNYIILPQVSDQKLLAKYYSLADVFVICSKRENFPTTCLEAQCCGTQVVGFDSGGSKETALNTENAFVQYGDIDNLTSIIKEKLNEENDCQALADAAHKAYSCDSMFQNYTKEYDKDGRKERILLLDVNCKSSSTGKIVYDLFKKAKEDGREAVVCYGRGNRITEEGIYKFAGDLETNIHAFLARITGYNGRFSPLATKKLIRIIDDFKPDIIHIHELHAYFVNIKELLLYIKKKNIPVVWTFHCEFMYTGKCGHAIECEGFMHECGNCPYVKEYPKSFIFDRTREMLKEKKDALKDLNFSIVVPSRWLAERIKLSFLKEKSVNVIHNGIDTSIFHPVDADSVRDELGIPKDYKVVLALAPNIMSDNKGGKWVVKMAEKMQNEKCFFLIVGDR